MIFGMGQEKIIPHLRKVESFSMKYTHLCSFSLAKVNKKKAVEKLKKTCFVCMMEDLIFFWPVVIHCCEFLSGFSGHLKS